MIFPFCALDYDCDREPGETIAMTSNIPVKEPVFTLSAGPVAVYPRVLRAMARPVHYDFDIFFQTFYEAVAQKLRPGAAHARADR